MAKKSVIERNKNVAVLVKKYSKKREALRAITKDRSRGMKEIFEANLQLAALPRNGAPTRYQNRCFVTGRARGYYRRFGISRVMIREMGLSGYIPGLIKSSW